MFRSIGRTLLITAIGAGLAGLTASAAVAGAEYDPYLDALRNQPSTSVPVRTVSTPAAVAYVRIGGQTVYDPYLDALRHRPASADRRLAVGSRRLPRPARGPIGRHRAE
jgi:hypothetical protein